MYSLLVLEPIIDKLNVHFYYASSSKQSSPENISAIKNRLENTYVTVKAFTRQVCSNSQGFIGIKY